MKDIGEIRFQRAVVPNDAVNLDIETIETADASNDLICCAIYRVIQNLYPHPQSKLHDIGFN